MIAVRPYGVEVQDQYTRPVGILHHGISKLFHLNCVSYNFICKYNLWTISGKIIKWEKRRKCELN